MSRDLKELEEKIGYEFHNKQLFRQAMIHSSYANEHSLDKLECNERLEFLGDAVLEVVSSEFLISPFPSVSGGRFNEDKGQHGMRTGTWLTVRERSSWASICCLARARRPPADADRNSIVSDAMEALIGAIYLDGGFANAKEFIHAVYL